MKAYFVRLYYQLKIEETLWLDERPDAGGPEHLEGVGTRCVGVGEHCAVDQVEDAAE